MVRTSLVFLFISLCGLLNAQVNRYAVFFTDKEGTPYSLDTPSQFLSQRAIERRVRQGIEYHENDLPVDPLFVSGLESAGADVFYTSKWFNAAIVQMDANLVSTVEALAYTKEVRLVGLGERLMTNSRKRPPAGGRTQSASTFAQLNQLGITNLHAEGFRGEGVLIAIFDSGFSGVNLTTPFSHIYNGNRLVDEYNFVLNSDDPYGLDNHGTEVLSVIGAIVVDEFMGAAPDAAFALYLTEDLPTEYRIEEFNWLIAAERADSAGVDIINSSLGYNIFDEPFESYTFEDMDGNTTVITRAVDLAASKGILVVSSAGNDGNTRPILAPADADSIISVGSVNSAGTIAFSSSSGPTFDGRIKPEVVARGVSTSVIEESGQVGTANGTSFSAPLVAGLAACIWQSKPNLTNIELRDTLLTISDRSDAPDNLYGYGLPRYGEIQITSLLGGEEVELVVYPNPVGDDLMYFKGLAKLSQTPEIRLINSQGLTLRPISQLIQDRTIAINMAGYMSGIYVLEVKTADKIERIKILKE